ncbi:hypothetical protein TNCV_4962941 [Trichonephila clavipes]|nr:hypothetical protein TNCV_4962941 [Trichonephila clavipes]
MPAKIPGQIEERESFFKLSNMEEEALCLGVHWMPMAGNLEFIESRIYKIGHLNLLNLRSRKSSGFQDFLRLLLHIKALDSLEKISFAFVML